ncbi:YitT family protein [Alteribacter natronophilus]|uniref:YitT family protein n=1 Tax=Alteribacter natronophilus TaxID=2583810 RepID=UPI00110F5D41|nr:YitT family protein [Alteribacter natronophilus]TMW71499.1 YitT family protein [Alteribacter natronophilus]
MLAKFDTSISEEIKKFSVSVGAALILAVTLNFFLIPANVFASGFTGLAQILAELVPVISTGLFLLLLNIPVAILGWKKVGKSFTFYSFVNVAATTFFLEVIPIRVISEDVILNAVFGGVLSGIGGGLVLKYGASSGGVDILALLMARYSDRSLGVYFFIMNSIIVISAGLLFGMEQALYTLLALYVASRIIDTIHTRHVKLTAMIVTKNPDEMQRVFHERVVRGVTRIPAKGGYTKEDKEILMIVITRYELYHLRHIIEEVDPTAFTNIIQTTGVVGMFRKD